MIAEGWRRLRAWVSAEYEEGVEAAMSETVTSLYLPTFEVVDLSSANPAEPNFARVKVAGVSAVYLRATDGVGWHDHSFEMRAVAAQAAGLDVGAYHFLRARHMRPQDAVEQVREFHSLVEGVTTLVPALDVEDEPNGEAYTGTELRDAVLAALGELERCFGAKPLLYTYPGFVARYPELRECSALAAYPAWLADYRGASAPAVPQPWQTWTAYQYAAGAGVHGRVDGIVGDVDRSRFRGRVEDYRLPSSQPSEL